MLELAAPPELEAEITVSEARVQSFLGGETLPGGPSAGSDADSPPASESFAESLRLDSIFILLSFLKK